MNPLDYQFHRAQARLKSNSLLALTTRFRGGQDVRPAFYPALTGIEPASKEDREHEYAVKKAALNACRVDMDRMSAVRNKVMQRIEMNRFEDRRVKRDAA